VTAIRDWFAILGRAFWRGVVEFYNSDDLTHAASVSYYALLSLFPFFLLVFSLLGQFAVDESRRVTLINFLLTYFPTHFDFLSQQLDALRQTRVRLGIGGSIAMLWAALGVFGAVSSAVNHAWGVEKQRSYLKHKLFSFFMLAAAGLLLVVALALISAVSIVQSSWFEGIVVRFPVLLGFRSLALGYGTTAMLIMVVGLIYYYVPNAKVAFWDVWPGAVLTGLLWRLTLRGFSYYVGDMSHYSFVHGSIAAVVVFLLWVYACAVVLLFGVEFTAAYARLRRGRADSVPAAPTPRT
jgi:membrane protein